MEDRRLESGKQRGIRLARMLEGWQQQEDPSRVRDADRLAQLPAEEQQTWQAFWQEVDALRSELE